MPARQNQRSAPMTMVRGAQVELPAAVSCYLDILRVAAAMTVLLSHYCVVLFSDLADFFPGHDSVVAFFVISGYVIAYVTAGRDKLVPQYTIHRLARLWSVLIPSLGVSLLAAVVVGNNLPNVPNLAPFETPWHFIAASLRTVSFTGENWLLTDIEGVPAPYNPVVWSLHYEAWYYAIFGTFMFAPRRWRWPASALIVVLAGPGVAALFPCWLIGVWLYWNHERLFLRPALAYTLFGGCIIAYGFAYAFHLDETSRHWLKVLTAGESYHLRRGNSAIGDTILAVLVAASIVAVDYMPIFNRMLARARRMMHIASSRTLSIYLYHMPLFAIFYALGVGRHGGVGALACIALGVGGSVLLGHISEARLRAWRSGLFWLYEHFRLQWSGKRPSPPSTPVGYQSTRLPVAAGIAASLERSAEGSPSAAPGGRNSQ